MFCHIVYKSTMVFLFMPIRLYIVLCSVPTTSSWKISFIKRKSIKKPIFVLVELCLYSSSSPAENGVLNCYVKI